MLNIETVSSAFVFQRQQKIKSLIASMGPERLELKKKTRLKSFAFFPIVQSDELRDGT